MFFLHSAATRQRHSTVQQNVPGISILLIQSYTSAYSSNEIPFSGSRSSCATIAIHNGIDAGQEILHVHIHIIPRVLGDGAGPVHSMFKNRPTVGSEKMDSIRDRIKEYLEQK